MLPQRRVSPPLCIVVTVSEAAPGCRAVVAGAAAAAALVTTVVAVAVAVAVTVAVTADLAVYGCMELSWGAPVVRWDLNLVSGYVCGLGWCGPLSTLCILTFCPGGCIGPRFSSVVLVSVSILFCAILPAMAWLCSSARLVPSTVLDGSDEGIRSAVLHPVQHGGAPPEGSVSTVNVHSWLEMETQLGSLIGNGCVHEAHNRFQP